MIGNFFKYSQKWVQLSSVNHPNSIEKEYKLDLQGQDEFVHHFMKG